MALETLFFLLLLALSRGRKEEERRKEVDKLKCGQFRREISQIIDGPLMRSHLTPEAGEITVANKEKEREANLKIPASSLPE